MCKIGKGPGARHRKRGHADDVGSFELRFSRESELTRDFFFARVHFFLTAPNGTISIGRLVTCQKCAEFELGGVAGRRSFLRGSAFGVTALGLASLGVPMLTERLQSACFAGQYPWI